MQLDLTAQLQPVIWGLIVGLLTSLAALAVAADRDEVDAFRIDLRAQLEWRRRLEILRERLQRLRSRTAALFSRLMPASRS